MKVASLVVMCMLAAAVEGFSQSGICWLGADIYGFVKGSMDICSGYAFADNWSLATDISLSYSRLKTEKDDIGAIHDGEFSNDSPKLPRPADLLTEHIAIRYWTQEALKGTFISTGIRYGSSTGIDYTLGIGYDMTLWKRLHMTAGYISALRNMMTDTKSTMDGMKICIYCTF